MISRSAQAKWEGSLREGNGTIKTESGALEGSYSFGTRFEDSPGTNPEELIGAAHAGCFSMAFALLLEKAGFPPVEIETRAEVKLEKAGEGFEISRILLDTTGKVPGIEEEEFQKQAAAAKDGCPVSKALAGTAIELKAQLKR